MSKLNGENPAERYDLFPVHNTKCAPSGGKRREMAGNGKYNVDITLN